MSQGPNAPDSMESTSDDRPGNLQEGIRPGHDDHATYFVLPELTHDSPAESASQIVDVVPRSPSTNNTFDPFTYVPFGSDPENDPRKYPWPVPVLKLTEPSPPSSIHEDIASLASKKSETRTSLEQKRKPTVGVTWGERETHAYEVESSREDKGEPLATASPPRSQPSPIPALTENRHWPRKPCPRTREGRIDGTSRAIIMSKPIETEKFNVGTSCRVNGIGILTTPPRRSSLSPHSGPARKSRAQRPHSVGC